MSKKEIKSKWEMCENRMKTNKKLSEKGERKKENERKRNFHYPECEK